MLPESQCGFRQRRGCTDMVFTVRQLNEKALENRARQYLIFVNLKKTYNSVPCETLWVELSKLGIQQLLINIISSFHENMKVRIHVEGELLEEIEVDNGFRHDCTRPPTMFNFYACLMAESWLCRIIDVEGVGTYLLIKRDQWLFI